MLRIYIDHYKNTPIQIYWKFYNQKKENFQIKNSDIFHIPAQNIDCGCSLEPPWRGGSNEYPQSMCLSRNKKNNVYPCKSQFCYIKVRFEGVKIIWACFHDVYYDGLCQIVRLCWLIWIFTVHIYPLANYSHDTVGATNFNEESVNKHDLLNPHEAKRSQTVGWKNDWQQYTPPLCFPHTLTQSLLSIKLATLLTGHGNSQTVCVSGVLSSIE